MIKFRVFSIILKTFYKNTQILTLLLIKSQIFQKKASFVVLGLVKAISKKSVKTQIQRKNPLN